MIATPNSDIHIPIIAETDDYLVIDKPAGMVAHQSEQHPTADTIANGLLAQWPMLSNVGEDPLRPGIVHRLDQGVSGVMVVAKTQEMFEYLKSQLQHHKVEKRYVTLAHGRFTTPTGEITFPIARSARRYTKMAARPDTSGKPAITKYTVVKQYQHYTLLELRIITGRTHQIRVHLNAIGHPLVGETLYVPKHFHSRLQPGRIFLHASVTSFSLPSGEYVTHAAPLPHELQAILDGLKPLP